MRSLFHNKRLILLLAVLALVALTVLATGLEQLPFREGQRFAQQTTESRELAPAPPLRSGSVVPLWKHMLAWLLILLLLVLVGFLVSPELRKRMLMILLRSVVTFWAVYLILRDYGDRLLPLIPQSGTITPGENGSLAPAPVFQPPQVSSTLSYLITLAVVLLALAAGWGVYRGWQKYAIFTSRPPLKEIARIARASLQELSSGKSSGDVIIDCYLRMSEVVSDKQKLSRAAAMTPREFALRLEQAGLPGDAVARLTRLFEMVRYGDRTSGPKEVNEAVSCLKTILHYCGEPV